MTPVSGAHNRQQADLSRRSRPARSRFMRRGLMPMERDDLLIKEVIEEIAAESPETAPSGRVLRRRIHRSEMYR